MPEFKRTSSDEIIKKIITTRSWSESSRNPDLPSGIRYTLAYDACRMWCEVVLRSENVRVKSTFGHHSQTIDKAADFLGEEFNVLQSRLHQARKTRNSVMYDGEIDYVTPSSVDNLIGTLDELEKIVMTWLEEKHPDLIPLV